VCGNSQNPLKRILKISISKLWKFYEFALRSFVNFDPAPFQRRSVDKDLKSISSGFYDLLLHRYSCTKKLQSQILTWEKLCRTLTFKKGASKMLIKLIPGTALE